MTEHRKVARESTGVERLRREADLLAQARHPGVVELVRLDDSGSEAVLVTAQVDGGPLAEIGSLDPSELAGLGAALATTLADLHELGLVHGSVRPDHVIVGRDGRPILCGFGEGGGVGEMVSGRSATLHPSVDIGGLGRILRQFAVGPAARPLRRLAQTATEPAQGESLSARDLAAQLEAALPGTRLPSLLTGVAPPLGSAADSTNRSRAPRRVAVRLAGGLSLLVVGAVAAAVVLADPHDRGEKTDQLSVRPPVTSTTTMAIVTTSTSSGPPTTEQSVPVLAQGCPGEVDVLMADVDGDGCEEVLTYADGVLSTGAIRWEIGRPGDVVVAGDWSCRRRRTLALLRPATGEVFRFDAWAVGFEDVTADRVGLVAGARALRTADIDGDGCHELVVERLDGTSEVLRRDPLSR